jgi:hypothetical protein
MATTANFGLNKFGSEGRITDNGSKFSNKDRDTIDALLFTLYSHDHRLVNTVVLEGPDQDPDLVAASGSGTLGANTNYFYRIAFVDGNGSETLASPAAIVQTDAPLGVPPVLDVQTADTGGTLDPGTYKYALSYYQSSGGETTAPNISNVVVPIGTSTNQNTITLDTLPSGATGWKIYRKEPGDSEYFLLASVTSGPTYVDDGTTDPDCTKKRATSNSTNASNSITISIHSTDLPLDSRVVSWRIYRSTSGNFGERSLIATQTETTTENGTDLVTSYTDNGDIGQTGIPLQQTTIPPAIPQLDAGDIFTATGKRLDASFAPLGTKLWTTFISGNVVNATTYNKIVPPYDMHVERIDLFYQNGGPTGTSGANYTTVRVTDDSLIDEVQEVYTDAAPNNEIQFLSNNATGGDFTISFDGQGPTNALDYNAPVEVTAETQELYNNGTTGDFTLGDGVNTTSAIAFDALASTVETRLQTDIAAIVDVNVSGAGTAGDPWVIDWADPLGPFIELTPVDNMSGGVSTITTTIQGQLGIKTELELLSNITTLAVTGGGVASDPWHIEFVDPGDQNVLEITTNDVGLTAGSSSISTETEGSDGGTFTLSDGVDTTSPIAFDAIPGTVETRLQTDITSITDVTVTGAGTEIDPFVITYVDPGDQDVPVLIADGTLLSFGAFAFVTTTTDGRANTVIDVDCQTDTDTFSWQSSTSDEGAQEAEEAPATGGVIVSDTLATNDGAIELDTQNEENYWNVGTLDAGEYVAYFYVSDVDQIATFDCLVVDDHLGAPSTMASITRSPGRIEYTPSYEVKFTSTGAEDIFFVVEKTDVSGVADVRVDKYEYLVNLPRLWAGQVATIEGLITGAPTTPGADVQVNVWY